MPNALQYIRDYLGASSGRDIIDGDRLKHVTEWASSNMGLGKSLPNTAIAKTSGSVLLFLMTNVKFLVANSLQSFLALPKYVDIRDTNPMSPNPLHAAIEGF